MLLLMDWYKANKLSLNVDKTVLLKFWSTSKVFDIKVGESTIINSPSTKFLGVIVDDHLTCKDHINQLYCKLTANKQLLMNAKNILPESCLLKIYYAHVYSHLTYGISIWGKMSQKSLQNSLYRLQKECVSIICKQKGPIDEVFKHLKIIGLPDLITFHQQKLGYKVTHKLLPVPILELFDRRGGKKSHRYPTRNKNTPNIQAHQNVTFNNSFLCKAIMDYNKLPLHLKCDNTIQSFVNKLKLYHLHQ